MFQLLLGLYQVANLLLREVGSDEVPVFIAEVEVKGGSSVEAFAFLAVVVVQLGHSLLHQVVLECHRSGRSP